MTVPILSWPDEAAMMAHLRAAGYAPTRYRYPPGAHFPPHSHPMDKIACVVAGHFALEMAGQRVVLGPLQGVHVPRGVVHSARVVGEAPVDSVDAIRW